MFAFSIPVPRYHVLTGEVSSIRTTCVQSAEYSRLPSVSLHEFTSRTRVIPPPWKVSAWWAETLTDETEHEERLYDANRRMSVWNVQGYVMLRKR